MVILHVSDYVVNKSSGVSVVVPQHVFWQQKCFDVQVALLDMKNNVIDDRINVFHEKTIMDLPKPFNNPDLVVFHEVYKISYIKLYKECKKYNIPYVIIPHGCLTKSAQKRHKIKKILGNILLFNSFINSANTIQYLCINEKNDSKQRNNSYIISGNGIDNIPMSNLYTISRKDTKKLNLIYVGRYDYIIKGIDRLLETFTLLKGKDIVLYLYGNGDKKHLDKIKNFIKEKKLENQVFLNGPIYGDKKREMILSNDVFIQVSRAEGQPLGIMEALCLGMPIIVSNGTGFSEIAEKNKMGFSVKNGESNKICDIILNIYDNKKELINISNNSFNFAIDEYSWDNVAVETIKKYKDIIER